MKTTFNKVIGTVAVCAFVLGGFALGTFTTYAAPGDVDEFVAANTVDATETSMFDLSEPEHVLEVLMFLNSQIAQFRANLSNGVGGIGGDGGPFDQIVEALKVGNNEMNEFVDVDSVNE